MAEQVPKNIAKSKLAVAVTSAGQTTLTLTAGTGAKFGATGTYRVLLWNNSDTGPFEICTVTSRTTDVLTVTRASESVYGVQTAFASWGLGTNIGEVLTEAAVTALLAAAGGGTPAILKAGPIHLATADILGLHAGSGIQVIPPPTSGHAIVVLQSVIKYNFSSVDFSTAGSIALYYSTLGTRASDGLLSLNQLFGFGVSIWGILEGPYSSGFSPTDVDGTGVVIWADTAITTGNGSLDVTVAYMVVP